MTAVVCFAFAVSLLLWSGRRRLDLVLDSDDTPECVVVLRKANDPLALSGSFDLFAAALSAGLAVSSAARAVAAQAPTPLGESLRKAADLLSLGADSATAWTEASRHRETESLARLARRSARSGASFAQAVVELAEGQRADVENEARARAERAGVLIAGPLGLCFLPAFVCLGIAPVVAGLGAQMQLEGFW